MLVGPTAAVVTPGTDMDASNCQMVSFKEVIVGVGKTPKSASAPVAVAPAAVARKPPAPPAPPEGPSCSLCATRFGSRNALFRHLRTAHGAGAAPATRALASDRSAQSVAARPQSQTVRHTSWHG